MMYDPSKPYKTKIQKLISATWKNPYIEVRPGIYPLISKKTSSVEVDHTDGIGTKGFYHWRQKTFRAAVIDALAMNLNDLCLMRAVPYKIQNHLTLPKDDHKAILAVIENLVVECKKRRIAITGGETSIHDNSDSMDLSISMTGIVKNPQPNCLQPGNILIGLPSNGLHSNGFSLVRKIFEEEQRPEFTKPTAIYINRILTLAEQVKISGMMHITGGAFTKLKDLLEACDAVIDKPLRAQPVFKELYARGVTNKQMYETFNCGTGFVLAVAPKDSEIALKITGGKVIGQVVNGSGIVIVTSAFNGQDLIY
jgi:phosphoribosylformylglycinamidine cyclo-ligase